MPEVKQRDIRGRKGDFLGADAAVIKNVFVKQPMET